MTLRLASLLVAFIFLNWYADLSTAQKIPACAGVADDQFVRNSASCNAYYSCWDQIAEEAFCPGAYLFEPLTQTCDLEENVDCTQCSPFGVQNLEDPSDRHMFYKCIRGVRTHHSCSFGLAFDARIGDCNLESSIPEKQENSPLVIIAPWQKLEMGNNQAAQQQQQSAGNQNPPPWQIQQQQPQQQNSNSLPWQQQPQSSNPQLGNQNPAPWQTQQPQQQQPQSPNPPRVNQNPAPWQTQQPQQHQPQSPNPSHGNQNPPPWQIQQPKPEQQKQQQPQNSNPAPWLQQQQQQPPQNSNNSPWQQPLQQQMKPLQNQQQQTQNNNPRGPQPPGPQQEGSACEVPTGYSPIEGSTTRYNYCFNGAVKWEMRCDHGSYFSRSARRCVQE